LSSLLFAFFKSEIFTLS
jgi:hypothetical protein